MLAKLENSPVATRMENSVFISISKKGNSKECLKYCTIVLISHASKVMLKILQARFQQYMNQELLDVQAGFRKAEETDQLPTSVESWKSKGIKKKKNYFFFINYAKAFDCVDQKKLKNS